MQIHPHVESDDEQPIVKGNDVDVSHVPIHRSLTTPDARLRG